jgi:hypothetical protein
MKHIFFDIGGEDMKNISMALCLAGMIFLPAAVQAASADAPIDPCLGCHDAATPGVVGQWQESKHSQVGVKCYVCHHVGEDDPAGFEHNTFRVTAGVSLNTCESCHPGQAQKFRDSMRDEAGHFSHSPIPVAKM